MRFDNGEILDRYKYYMLVTEMQNIISCGIGQMWWAHISWIYITIAINISWRVIGCPSLTINIIVVSVFQKQCHYNLSTATSINTVQCQAAAAYTYYMVVNYFDTCCISVLIILNFVGKYYSCK